MRAGIQPFVSDFRGLIFSDFNLGARLFGNAANNRWQYNLAYFDLLEKETNSELNTFEKREQKVFIANVFRQDSFTKGYTLSLSFHRSEDERRRSSTTTRTTSWCGRHASGRPACTRSIANYVGLAGDGHVGRINVSHAVVLRVRHDEDHVAGGGRARTSARGMAALEASIDKDWARFKGSVFFASGDDDAARRDGAAASTAIYDNIELRRRAVQLLEPLRHRPHADGGAAQGPGQPAARACASNKFEGQANFVNPGLAARRRRARRRAHAEAARRS